MALTLPDTAVLGDAGHIGDHNLIAAALAAIDAPTQSAKTTDYTFGLVDAGAGAITLANKATAIAFTIPPQASVTWTTGNVIRWVNRNDGVLTITPGAAVTFIGTSLTYAKGTGGAAYRTASNEWVIVPFRSGGSAAPVVNEGASTNVTFSTLTNPDGDGKNYRLAAWTANGTLSVTTAGEAEVLLVGAGNSNNGGRVCGGKRTLPSGTLTVTIPAANSGGAAILGSLTTGLMGAPVNAGNETGAGGTSGANLTAGLASSITGASVTYAAGGSGGTDPGDSGQPGIVYARWEA